MISSLADAVIHALDNAITPVTLRETFLAG